MQDGFIGIAEMRPLGFGDLGSIHRKAREVLGQRSNKVDTRIWFRLIVRY